MDQPYTSVETVKTVVNSEEHNAEARDALLKSIVMLKNNDLIKPAGEEKLTVYIPYKYTPASTSRRGTTPASVGPCMDIQVAQEYFNVITDKPGTPSGEGGTYLPTDIIRASDEEIASADLTLVRVSSPTSDAPTTSYDENMQNCLLTTSTFPAACSIVPIQPTICTSALSPSAARSRWKSTRASTVRSMIM